MVAFNKRIVEGRLCLAAGTPGARFVCIQPLGEEEIPFLAEELACLQEGDGSLQFQFLGFPVANWNQDLSPWEAPPVFGKEGFGGEAGRTLSFIRSSLLPAYGITPVKGQQAIVLGGYSLAGLFSLWASYQEEGDFLDGVAAASPSVWFPGWTDYVKTKDVGARAVYLSLGDREHRSKNPLLRQVNDALETQYQLLLCQGVLCTRVWNQGTHFQEAPQRTGRAFRWVIQALGA